MDGLGRAELAEDFEDNFTTQTATQQHKSSEHQLSTFKA